MLFRSEQKWTAERKQLEDARNKLDADLRTRSADLTAQTGLRQAAEQATRTAQQLQAQAQTQTAQAQEQLQQLQQQQAQQQQQIQQLQQRHQDQKQRAAGDHECSICLESTSTTVKVWRSLGCGLVFCGDCVPPAPVKKKKKPARSRRGAAAAAAEPPAEAPKERTFQNCPTCSAEIKQKEIRQVYLP